MMDLHNDTVVNVAALLKERVGAFRRYGLALDRLPLDDDLDARDISGNLRLTRITDGVLAAVEAAGVVELTCLRCLRQYDESFAATFDEEFRTTVDVRTGIDVMVSVEDERFPIDQNHELDIAEPLRQEILVALPMRPVCGNDCPGPDVLETTDDDEGANTPFAALKDLLAEPDA